MAAVAIDWDSVSVHDGTLTVLLRGDGTRDATWVDAFNHDPASVTNPAWGSVQAHYSGNITVAQLIPGHAAEIKDALDRHVAAANAQMTARHEVERNREEQEAKARAEQDARDQALLDEFRKSNP
jgi:hypothetical protein